MTEALNQPQPSPYDGFVDRALDIYYDHDPIYLLETAVEEALGEHLAIGGDIRKIATDLYRYEQQPASYLKTRLRPEVNFNELAEAESLEAYLELFSKILIIDEILERDPEIEREDERRYYVWDPHANPANWEEEG